MPDHLWAPWRLRYIETTDSATPGCIFCELPKQAEDRKNLILHRGELAFIIMNRYPYTNGHLMVAPYRHTGDFAELTAEEGAEMFGLVQRSIQLINAAYAPQGFNIGINQGSAAGAGIPGHLHIHILPRWSGDTNFITTIGETRVLPQSLEESFDRLAAGL